MNDSNITVSVAYVIQTFNPVSCIVSALGASIVYHLDRFEYTDNFDIVTNVVIRILKWNNGLSSNQ